MSGDTTGPGPYISPDHDEIYLPVDFWTYRQARAEAANMAREIRDDWSRSRYVGKLQARLCNHDEWEGCEDNSHFRLAWHFEVYERS